MINVQKKFINSLQAQPGGPGGPGGPAFPNRPFGPVNPVGLVCPSIPFRGKKIIMCLQC